MNGEPMTFDLIRRLVAAGRNSPFPNGELYMETAEVIAALCDANQALASRESRKANAIAALKAVIQPTTHKEVDTEKLKKEIEEYQKTPIRPLPKTEVVFTSALFGDEVFKIAHSLRKLHVLIGCGSRITDSLEMTKSISDQVCGLMRFVGEKKLEGESVTI